jgi:hypothetical protein
MNQGRLAMTTVDSLAQELDRELKKQVTWRRVMSGAYFVTSAVAITCSGAATVAAGLEMSTEAAVLAGGATVLFGLEKAMLFREKWAHHLGTSTQIQALKLQYLHGDVSDASAARRIGEILTEYAIGLPIARREKPE